MPDSLVIQCEIEPPKVNGLMPGEQAIVEALFHVLTASEGVEARGVAALMHATTGYVYQQVLEGSTPKQQEIVGHAYHFFLHVFNGKPSAASIIEERIIELVEELANGESKA